MSAVTGAVSTVLWGLLVVSFVVFTHELGHYLAARACGVRVTELFLGLPCPLRLARRMRRTGTLVGATPLLLGGYTRICGMGWQPGEGLAEAYALVSARGRANADELARALPDRSAEEVADLLETLVDWAALQPAGEDVGEDGEPVPAWSTVARDASGLTAYDAGNRVGEPGGTEAGEPRELADPQAALDAERARTYLGCGWPRRLLMLAAGPLANLVCAFVLVVAAYSAMGVSVVVDAPAVSAVEPGSLADEAGLEAGDTVIEVDGVACDTWTGLGDAIDASLAAGGDFELVWEHDGELRSAVVEPGAGDDALGVSATTDTVRLPVADSLRLAASLAGETVSFATRLLVPTETVATLDQSTSLVGIAVLSEQAARMGAAQVVSIVASLSMSLCVMNLLPIPPLDGGKVVLELVEAVRRRPVSARVVNALSLAGVAFFLFVFVWVLRADIVRFF